MFSLAHGLFWFMHTLFLVISLHSMYLQNSHVALPSLRVFLAHSVITPKKHASVTFHASAEALPFSITMAIVNLFVKFLVFMSLIISPYLGIA